MKLKYLSIVLIILLCSITALAQTPADYFRIAAESNPGLQAQYKEYEATLQKVAQVNALPDPVFSFAYFVSPAETRVGPQRARLSLNQMFPWFGTLRAQGDAAALMAESKFQGFIDARNRLYLQVASAYYPLYELKEFISIEEENVNILETYKNIVLLKFENGTGSMVDVLRVDIMLTDAQTNIEILRSKERPLAIAFNKLLNRSEDEPVIVSDTLITEPISVDHRRDSLIAANPRLRSLDLRLKAGKASELVAQNLGKPRLGIGLDYVVVGERTDMSMPDNGKDIVMPMVSVSLPIFRSKYKASVREAQLLQESYIHEKQQVANSLVSDYEMALFEIQQQLQLLELFKQQVQTTRQSLNLLFSSYSNYGREFEEVLRMQQELLKYRKLQTTALVNYNLALSRMDYLTSKEL